MSKTIKERGQSYQLRHAAGCYFLLDMGQAGVPYKRPLELNEIGAKIWEMMAEGCTTEQIADNLATEYDAESEEIRQDVLAFYERLSAYGVKIGE